jgi:hypothetical protein
MTAPPLPSPPPNDQRCTATAKGSGERCKGWRVTGFDKCATHGPGKIKPGKPIPPQRLQAQRRAAVLEAHAQAERMLAAAGVDADPIEHLLDSLHRVAALAAVYGQMVAGLDAASQNGGVRGKLGYVEAEGDSDAQLQVIANDELLGLDRHGAAQLHPFVVEYHRLLEQRAKLAKLAIDAGVAERQVRLAEQQGQVIVTVVRRSLEVLGVEVTEQVTRVVAGELRAIAG